jgi:large subunit ribosomal protein L24
MAMHVKKGDMVMVIAGDDKGRTGEIMKVMGSDGKVVVQGINRVWRHVRPNRQNPRGGRIQKELPIHISNVLPVDPETSQATRVTFKINEDGSKDRVAKKSGKSLGSVKKAK